jgi:hypothetical protein
VVHYLLTKGRPTSRVVPGFRPTSTFPSRWRLTFLLLYISMIRTLGVATPMFHANAVSECHLFSGFVGHSIDSLWGSGGAFTFMTPHISIHLRHLYGHRPNCPFTTERALTYVNLQMAWACRCYQVQDTYSVTSWAIRNFLLSERWC